MHGMAHTLLVTSYTSTIPSTLRKNVPEIERNYKEQGKVYICNIISLCMPSYLYAHNMQASWTAYIFIQNYTHQQNKPCMYAYVCMTVITVIGRGSTTNVAFCTAHSFLATGVPDTQFHITSIHFHCNVANRSR